MNNRISSGFGPEYGARIERMAQQVKGWLDSHPGVNPILTFTVPEKVFLIVPLNGALQTGAIVVDDTGRRMLDDLGWTADTPAMPTYTMVKVAFAVALKDNANAT